MTARRKIIPLFIPHLGCPHDCVFCNQKRISGSLSPVRPEDVAREVEKGLALCGRGAELAFYGGSFTAMPVAHQEALLEAARPYAEAGDLSGIRLSTRPDAVSGKTLDLLERYHVRTIELGAQSMADSVLAACGRGHSAADTERAARLIKDRGFSLILQMMTGLPGSSKELDILTARRLAALGPDGVRLYPTVIIRDTPLYDRWRAGEYAEHSVADAVEVCAEILPLFESAGIPVIRLGLNPTDDLSGGQAAGGAYHPALGELVKSRVLRNRARELLRGTEPDSEVILGVNRACVSQMIGQHRCNLDALTAEFGLKSLKVRALDAKTGEILLVSVAKGKNL
ncbi:MAG: elongator complex protein 3 [Oscillospiraceae bacterium]